MSLDEKSALPESALGLTAPNDSLDEANAIIARAKSDSAVRPKLVSSSEDLALHDPISRSSGEAGLPDNGVNIINSFVNRTVFFDYFRHVAHKRFPDRDPRERVHALAELEPRFYQRSIISDYWLKLVTSFGVLGSAVALIAKAIFF